MEGEDAGGCSVLVTTMANIASDTASGPNTTSGKCGMPAKVSGTATHRLRHRHSIPDATPTT